MPVFTNQIAKRCARWILLTTSPAPLPMLHPARDDMAAAADEIERLSKILLGVCQSAKSCQHPAGCVCDIDPTTLHFPDRESTFCINDPRVICPGGPECCESDNEF